LVSGDYQDYGYKFWEKEKNWMGLYRRRLKSKVVRDMMAAGGSWSPFQGEGVGQWDS
jgi:hypothetical protein